AAALLPCAGNLSAALAQLTRAQWASGGRRRQHRHRRSTGIGTGTRTGAAYAGGRTSRLTSGAWPAGCTTTRSRRWTPALSLNVVAPAALRRARSFVLHDDPPGA